MLLAKLLLLLLLLLLPALAAAPAPAAPCAAAAPAAALSCSFPARAGAGPGGASSLSGNITCAPLGGAYAPATISVTATAAEMAPAGGVYTDVTTFSYADAPAAWPGAPNRQLPGRRVKVAAADVRDWFTPCCSMDGTCACTKGPQGSNKNVTIANNMQRALAIVDAAGAAGMDVVQLPEEFKYSWVTTDRAVCPNAVCAEPLRGPTYQLLKAKAIQYKMHIVYGTRENATEENAVYNTAVVLDRAGEIAGTYRKVFPFSGPTNHPGLNASPDGITIVDLDFGRVAFLTCFDANFAELWFQAMAGGAELVFWGSAYGGGNPLRAAALMHNYHIVSSGWGEFIGNNGVDVAPDKTVKLPTGLDATLRMATLDLDSTMVNFNSGASGRNRSRGVAAEQSAVIGQADGPLLSVCLSVSLAWRYCAMQGARHCRL